jgi:hypothetical protein
MTAKTATNIVGNFFSRFVTGPLNRSLIVLFGENWRTSVYGILAVLPQLADPLQDYLGTIAVSKSKLNLISLVFAVMFAMTAKDRQVTGKNK